MAAKIIAVILLLAGLGLGGLGISQVAEQHRKISTYIPAKARVLRTDIKEHVTHGRHGRSVSYEPIVQYRYRVKDAVFVGQTVLPCSQRGSSSWAREIIGRYPMGRDCEAYYDPANPTSSFLIRHYAFSPYIIVLIAGSLGTIGAGMLYLAGPSLKTMPAPMPVGQNLFRLSPKLSISRRLNGWGSATLVGILAAGLAFGHYFAVADAKETAGIVCALVAAAICAALAAMTVRYWLLSRQITDAAVVIDSLEIRSGQRLNVRVQQRLQSSAMVEELRLGLVCVETYQSSGSKKSRLTRKVYEEWFALMANHAAGAGQTLDASYALQIPAGTPPSTPSKRKGLPRFDWKLCVKTKLAAMPDYGGEYPIFVLPGNGQGVDELEAISEA